MQLLILMFIHFIVLWFLGFSGYSFVGKVKVLRAHRLFPLLVDLLFLPLCLSTGKVSSSFRCGHCIQHKSNELFKKYNKYILSTFNNLFLINIRSLWLFTLDCLFYSVTALDWWQTDVRTHDGLMVYPPIQKGFEWCTIFQNVLERCKTL